ncbi:TetR/AcrR family transcriptional regulator [Actinoplanes sp. NPDC049265]|uniref:TetR/AcrR family transcriptional regulator n=1 Tax=Actinoplanes sp. NPDC049265 TaxID=3363902 RepID=UPI0037134DB8
MTARPISRQAEYAQATREAIRDAAGRLFVTNGYFDTKVADIAAAARVSPATVYAVGGGKSGLLRDLLQAGMADQQIAGIKRDLEAEPDPNRLLALLVEARQRRFDQWAGLLRAVVAAAPQEASVRESLDMTDAAIRAGLAGVARRLADMEALRPGLTADRAAAVLWYYTGNASFFTLVDDLGWSLPDAAAWIGRQLTHALLDR